MLYIYNIDTSCFKSMYRSKKNRTGSFSYSQTANRKLDRVRFVQNSVCIRCPGSGFCLVKHQLQLVRERFAQSPPPPVEQRRESVGTLPLSSTFLETHGEPGEVVIPFFFRPSLSQSRPMINLRAR